LKHRERNQLHTIWRDTHTLIFFRNHPKPARSRIGRKAIRFARAELRWTRRELAQTRASLAPPPVAMNESAWACIHRGEGSWDANTGNGYYGGLQMNLGFQTSWGPEFYRQWGTADNWPPWAQMAAAQRAHDSGLGYSPWPNTARMCGLF
jgi:hypothetical protein